MAFRRKHSTLGFAIFFISLSSVLACYMIATRYQGLYPFMPSISETADSPPASCIFTFLMGFSNFFITLSIYIRYKDLQAHLITYAMHVVNVITLVVGSMMCVSMLIVISFQQINAPSVHYPAAVMLFACSVVYMWLHAVLSHHMRITGVRKVLSRGLVVTRFLIASIQVLAILGCAVFSLLWYLYESHLTARKDMFWWSMNAVCEYVMAACLGVFWVALFPEFRNLQIDVKVEWMPDPEAQVLIE